MAPFEVEEETIAIPIAMATQTAMTVRNNLRLIIVCRAAKPATSRSERQKDATIDDPVDIVTTHNYINVELLELWVYDEISGKLYHKGDAKQASIASLIGISSENLSSDIQQLRMLPSEYREQIKSSIDKLKVPFTQQFNAFNEDETFAAEMIINPERKPERFTPLDSNKLYQTTKLLPDGPFKSCFVRLHNAIVDVKAYEESSHWQNQSRYFHSSAQPQVVQPVDEEALQKEILAKYKNYKSKSFYRYSHQVIYVIAIQNYRCADLIWSLVSMDPPTGSVNRLSGNPYNEREKQESPPPLKPFVPRESEISVSFVPPLPISLPKPAYPSAVRVKGVAGIVTVNVKVDAEGRVVSAEVVSGDPLLHKAAINAAMGARFSPARRDGKPTASTTELTYTFVP